MKRLAGRAYQNFRNKLKRVRGKPIPGCWNYNHNSKRTLESAGYASNTRLLRIDFVEAS
jgi:hypothetical protein